MLLVITVYKQCFKIICREREVFEQVDTITKIWGRTAVQHVPSHAAHEKAG